MFEDADTPTILIVDNDAHGRKFLTIVLTQAGYKVLVAENAEAALHMDVSQVGLLITDLIMPGMLGAQLSAEMRKKLPHVRELFVSGFPEHAARSFGYLPQAPFLEKPIASRALLSKVRELLPQRAALALSVA